MSSRTLREEIAAWKVLHPPVVECVETDHHHPVSFVTFYPWRAKEWTLPWARLEALSFCQEDGAERLELYFPNHHVIAIGENLRATVGNIRSSRVGCLRVLLPSHQGTLGAAEPFIHQLDVRLFEKLEHRLSGGTPFQVLPA